MRVKVLSVALLFVLVVSSLGTPDKVVWDKENPDTALEQMDIYSISYDNHDPIVISSDADFLSQGWSGFGNTSHPFVIENLRIANDSICISISDTSVHVLIQNCLFIGAPSAFQGIIMDNTTNIEVASCNFENIDHGLVSTNGDSIIVENCSFTSGESYQISIRDGTAAEVRNNSISNSNAAISTNIDSALIIDNIISDNDIGLEIAYASNCTVFGNTFSGDGLVFLGDSIEHFRHNMSMNTLNGLPIGYFWSEKDLNINQNYGQVIFANCTDSTVDGVFITDCYHAIQFLYSQNCSVINSEFTACRIPLKVDMSNYTVIERNDFYDCTIDFINIEYSANCTISSNMMDNTYSTCAEIMYSDFVTISSNFISDPRHYTIHVYDSKYPVIFNNTLEGWSGNLYLQYVEFANVSNNQVRNGFGNGMSINHATNSTFYKNWFKSNMNHGINLDSSDYNTFIENYVLTNDGAGIQIDSGCNDNFFVNNTIAWNDLGTAYDGGTNTIWDDGVAWGNSWDDYSGVGDYVVPGSAGSIDHFPLLATDTFPPVIEHPEDFTYYFGATPPSLSWDVSDDFIDYYTIWLNGTLYRESTFGGWLPLSVGVRLNFLTPGVYNFTVRVNDTSNNAVFDTVFVTVAVHQDAIFIDGDDEFELQSWPGTGSIGEPYLIEGFTINWSTCIIIINTRSHFVISDCILGQVGSTTGSAIFLQNVTNGLVEHCTISYGESCVRLNNANFTTVSDCFMDETRYGLFIQGSSNDTVIRNTIRAPNGIGVKTEFSEDISVSENDISDCHNAAIQFTRSEYCHAIENTVYGNAWTGGGDGISLDESVNCTVIDNTIFDNLKGVGLQTYSEDCVISGNEIFNNLQAGVYANPTPNNTITYNHFYNNSRMGVQMAISPDCTISHNVFDGDGLFLTGQTLEHYEFEIENNTVNGKPLGFFWNLNNQEINGSNYGQVILVNCINTDIYGSLSNTCAGYTLAFCNYCSVNDAQVYDSEISVVLENSNNCIVSNLLSKNNAEGVLSRYTQNCTIEDSEFISCGISVASGEVFNFTIRNNVIFNCSRYDFGFYTSGAILMTSSLNCTVVDNIICYNQGSGFVGLNFAYSAFLNNTICGNQGYGIYLTSGSRANLISENRFGWNDEGNAFDQDGSFWNDTTDTGNSWSDYVGTGVYIVEGSGIVTSIDHHPNLLSDDLTPTINHPENFDVQLYSDECIITWQPNDEFPCYYEVSRDDAIIESGYWYAHEIIVPIDTSSLGVFEFSISLSDVAGNTASDSVLVTVEAPHTLPPTTTTPTPTPTGTGPGVLGIETLLVVGAIGGVLVLLVVFIRQRNKLS